MSQAGQPRDRAKRNMRGGCRIGDGTNYMTVNSSGAVTQTGAGGGTWLGTHTAATFNPTTSTVGTLNVTTANISGTATFTAAPALSGSGRPTHSLFIPAVQWSRSASAGSALLNTRWWSLYFNRGASSSDVTIYANAMLPREIDVSGGLTPYVVWSLGARAASAIADWRLTAQSIDSNEATSTASTAEIAAGASPTAGYATNKIYESNLGTFGESSIADGDYLALALQLNGASGFTTSSCPYFIGLRLDYYADTL